MTSESEKGAAVLSLLARLKQGLQKTRSSFTERLGELLHLYQEPGEELYEELEALLVGADVGLENSLMLVEKIRQRVKAERVRNPLLIREMLKDEVRAILAADHVPLRLPGNPSVILVVGVNGVGKTTTVGKLAWRFRQEGKGVVLAAADTFRAAAAEQLAIWAKRTGAECVRHREGADPAAVAFDAVAAAQARRHEVVLVDTAGRLHTKSNLMAELGKINRVIGRSLPGAPHETLLVVDATTGQNALQQAAIFHQAIGLTGVVLAKLDGTAKGGIVVAIKQAFRLPIKLIGVGERVEDLEDFVPEAFVEALFGEGQ
ncbi:MAG: signal recognition particle-docking protein FtsY [Clostridia bacterium]|nr:signal recognition particle-docking protein FtsY [Clostridia bacterium]